MKSTGSGTLIPFATLLLIGGLTGCMGRPVQSELGQVSDTERLARQSDGRLAQSEAKPHEVHKEVASNTGNASLEVSSPTASVPKVVLSAEHSAMCRVRVSDELPEISLPQLSGPQIDLAALRGKKATVVLFWQSDLWMSDMALRDLAKDFAPSEDVAVVGIAVKESKSEIESALKDAGAEFPQLLDSDGKAFNQVGMVKMPRVYVLDAAGKIAWFDIEYSQSTQRELWQTMEALTMAE